MSLGLWPALAGSLEVRQPGVPTALRPAGGLPCPHESGATRRSSRGIEGRVCGSEIIGPPRGRLILRGTWITLKTPEVIKYPQGKELKLHY